MGRHAHPRGEFFDPARWAIGAAVLTWVLTILRHQPCVQTGASGQINRYQRLCYSDIPVIFTSSGMGRGGALLAERSVRQSPITVAIMAVNRWLVGHLGWVVGPTATDQQVTQAANAYWALSSVLLFLGFLATVVGVMLLGRGSDIPSPRPATSATTPTAAVVTEVAARTRRRSWDVFLVACSPLVLAAGMVDFTLVPVGFMTLSLLAWATRRPTLAGVLAGLAVSGSLQTAVVVLAVVVLCLRAGKLASLGRYLGPATGVLVICHGVAAALSPAIWRATLAATFGPQVGLGSLWFIFQDATKDSIAHVGVLSSVLAAAGLLWLTWFVWRLPRRPRVAQVALVALVIIFVAYKSYSPQYSLLLVPLAALACPDWRNWGVLMTGEVFYQFVVWGHLAGATKPAGSTVDAVYWGAIIVRVAAQVWFAWTVVDEMRRPWNDSVRAGYGDDPTGGVLDHAPDAPVIGALSTAEASSTTLERSTVSPTVKPVTPADDPVLVRRTWIGTRILLGLTLVLVMAAKDLSFVQATGNWDVKHFVNIARHGYADPLEMAFFPGLPAIMHAGSWIGLPPEITGVVVALVCSGLAAAALYRIGGAVPAMLWLIAPTAAFTTIGYTEAPFVAAAFWAWERARSNRWWQAAALAAVACTMRVSGLFLVGALAVMAVVGDGEKPARRRGSKRRIDVEQVCSRLATLIIPAAVLVCYVIFLHELTGSWTAWHQAQEKGWGRGFTTPLQTLHNTLPATHTDMWRGVYHEGAPRVAMIFRFELVSVAIGLVTTIYCLLRRRWASAAWVGIQIIAFSIGHWYMSVNRAVLLWFPTAIMLAEAAAVPSRPNGLVKLWRGVVMILVVADLGVMCWWGWQLYTGAWAS